MTKLGVLKPEDLDLFPGLFKCFKADGDQIVFSDDNLNLELRGWSDDGRRWYNGNDGSAMLDERGTLKPRTRMKTKPVPVEIRVEGVWDTVGSLGLPDSRLAKILGFNKKFQFYNTALNDSESIWEIFCKFHRLIAIRDPPCFPSACHRRTSRRIHAFNLVPGARIQGQGQLETMLVSWFSWRCRRRRRRSLRKKPSGY
jgi:hypothetical protein